MELKDHIDDICKKLREGTFTNEEEVRIFIVMRLLGVLKWPQEPQIVKPEYTVKKRRVDLALCHPPKNPIVFIEVKQVGNLSEGEEQLFTYAFHEGIPVAILTDGQHWNFYYPIGEGNYKNRKVRELDLLESDSEESVKCISRYLSYEAIQTGNALESIKVDYQNVVKQKQIEKRLPEAWQKLLQDEDELLIEIMADKTKSLCKVEPTKEQVLTFLKGLDKRTEPSPVPPIDTTPNVDSLQRSKPQQYLRVTMHTGDMIDHHNAQQTLREVVEKLGCQEIMRVNPTLVSNEPFKHGRQERIGEYYLSKNHGSPEKKRHLERVAQKLNIKLEVELIDK